MGVGTKPCPQLRVHLLAATWLVLAYMQPGTPTLPLSSTSCGVHLGETGVMEVGGLHS